MPPAYVIGNRVKPRLFWLATAAILLLRFDRDHRAAPGVRASHVGRTMWNSPALSAHPSPPIGAPGLR